MNKFVLAWLVMNSGFLLALYFGLWYGPKWIAYLAVLVVWISLIGTINRYREKRRAPSHERPPAIIGLAVDIAAIYMLLSHEWFISGAAYSLMIMLDHLTNRKMNTDGISEQLEVDFRVASEVATLLSQEFKNYASCHKFSFDSLRVDDNADLILGFIFSASDEFAQRMGGTPNGNASLNGALHALKEMFGDRYEDMFHRMVDRQNASTKDFSDGCARGGFWADSVLKGNSVVSQAVVTELLQAHYPWCCQKKC
jgi:hypothetical protein